MHIYTYIYIWGYIYDYVSSNIYTHIYIYIWAELAAVLQASQAWSALRLSALIETLRQVRIRLPEQRQDCLHATEGPAATFALPCSVCQEASGASVS